jgi:molybdopterin converting factor small subunit
VNVTVRLFATLRDFLPQHAVGFALSVQVEAHEPVRALLRGLGVPDDLPRFILVNGQHASEDSLLTEGDVVSVFPPLVGGRSSMGD